MTNIALIPTNEVDRKLVQFVEVVTGVRDLPWLETQPSYSLQDALKVPALLCLRVGVVVTQITLSAVERCITEVHEDSFRVTDVEEAVRFRREPCVYDSLGGSEMLLAEVCVNLRVLTDFVKVSKEAFREHRTRRGCLRCRSSICLLLCCPRVFLGLLL